MSQNQKRVQTCASLFECPLETLPWGKGGSSSGVVPLPAEREKAAVTMGEGALLPPPVFREAKCRRESSEVVKAYNQ